MKAKGNYPVRKICFLPSFASVVPAVGAKGALRPAERGVESRYLNLDPHGSIDFPKYLTRRKRMSGL